MDQTLVDVTDIPDVKMNDEVTVFGPENAAIVADTADSIAARYKLKVNGITLFEAWAMLSNSFNT